MKILYVEHVRRQKLLHRQYSSKNHYDAWLLSALINRDEVSEVIVVASDINLPKMHKIQLLLTSPLKLLPNIIALLVRYTDIKIVHIHYEIDRYNLPALVELILCMFIVKFLLRRYVLFSLYNPFFDPNNYRIYLSLLTGETNQMKLYFYRLLLILFYRCISICSNRIIVHAKIFKNFLYNLGIKNIITISHGYLKPIFLEQGSSGKYILIFGVISRRKRLEEILEAYKNQKPGIPLIVAGGPSRHEKEYYEILLSKYNGKFGITFIGFVPDESLIDVIKESKLIILPQPLAVTPSGVLTQLTSYCKPVFGPKTNLYFIEYLPPEALFDSICFSHLLDETLLKRVSLSLIERAFRESFDQVILSYINLYKELIDKKR